MLFDDVMAKVQEYFGSVDAKVASLDAEVAVLTARGVATAAEVAALKATQLDPVKAAELLAAIQAAADKLAQLGA